MNEDIIQAIQAAAESMTPDFMSKKQLALYMGISESHAYKYAKHKQRSLLSTKEGSVKHTKRLTTK